MELETILKQKEGIRSLKGKKISYDCCFLVVFLAGQKKHSEENAKGSEPQKHMEITPQRSLPLGASAAGMVHRLITQPHTAATLGNCSQCPGHSQALHRETLNTTPMGK